MSRANLGNGRSWFRCMSHGDFGEVFVELDDAAVVVGGFAVHLEGLHDFHDGLERGMGHAEVVGGVQGVGEVLDVEFDAEAGLEVAGEHHGDFGVHDGAAGEAALDGFKDFLRDRRRPWWPGRGPRRRRRC